jgi:hypothetical protein
MFQRHCPPHRSIATSLLGWHMLEDQPGIHAVSGIIGGIQGKIKGAPGPAAKTKHGIRLDAQSDEKDK